MQQLAMDLLAKWTLLVFSDQQNNTIKGEVAETLILPDEIWP